MTSSKARRQRRRAERATDAKRDGLSTKPNAPAPRSSGDRFRMALVLLALAYLTTVWFDGVGSTLPAKLTPRPWLYFGQVAALFKHAGMMAIDYRAEGWSCSERRWVEIDVRPFFRIDADTKENRFHRALQFYRRERKVMRALEDYVTRSHNEAPGRASIGGVRFLSLRIPYPKLGERIEPYERKPLSAYPEDTRRAWYYTPTSRRRAACRDQTTEPIAPEERSSDGMIETKDAKEVEP